MSKIIIVIWCTLGFSLSAYAGESLLVCSGKVLNGGATINVSLASGEGMLPIDLGKGRTLKIDFFGDDVRFSEIRKPTKKETDDFYAQYPDGEEIGLRGITVAYSQTSIRGSIIFSTFNTEDLTLSCELKP